VSAAPPPSPPPEEAELHAYVDGHLPADRVAAVEAWLAADAEARARADAWRSQNELITRLYDGEARAPLPVRRTADRLLRERHRGRWRIAAAVLLALLAGGGTGWLANDLLSAATDPTDGLAHAGVALHRVTSDESPAGLAEHDEGQLAAQLARSLGHPVEIPDLAQVGLRLVGGRALPLAVGQAAAQLTYEDGAGANFTLYLVRPRPPEAGDFREVDDAGIAGVVWPYEEFHCLLVGDAPRGRLLEIAQAVQAQLDAEGSSEG
jgi:anti-sigma factor RsiW